jgi:type IV pilus assembly protein PilQ
MVNNGETVVLGGVFEQTKRNDASKVPLLGDIPLLGYLFRTTSRGATKRELLIFVTPQILRNSSLAER